MAPLVALSRPPRAPGRRRLPLRPRMVLIFTTVAAASCAALALTSYLLVQQGRVSSAIEGARLTSLANLRLAPNFLPADPRDGDLGSLASGLAQLSGFDVVILQDTRSFQSSDLGPGSISPALRRAVQRGRLALVRTEVAGSSYLIVGARLAAGGPELFFFYPFGRVVQDLHQLRLVLIAITAVVLALSGLVGWTAARALLLPIRQAAQAAQRMEEGALDSRLPEEGRDELAGLARSFNAMASSLEATVANLSALEASHQRFVSDVSHELRTPVTALCASADLLALDLPRMPAEPARAGGLLVASVHQLRVLVEDLMEISRLNAGVAPVAWEPVDVGQAVQGCAAARGWQDSVIFSVAGDLRTLADPRRLDAIFGNLLENAFGHGAPPVHVAASVTPDGRWLSVTVSDNGPGIGAEHLPKVFDRFYKADPSRPRSRGSGLGLAIARENARLHGGDITVVSGPRDGTAFTVSLPRRAVGGDEGSSP